MKAKGSGEREFERLVSCDISAREQQKTINCSSRPFTVIVSYHTNQVITVLSASITIKVSFFLNYWAIIKEAALFAHSVEVFLDDSVLDMHIINSLFVLTPMKDLS